MTDTRPEQPGKAIRWAAIGDSFTYLNDHLDETGYRVSRGYLSRIADRIPALQLTNLGINGSTLADWIDQPIPGADLYTVLLGTNDWHAGFPLGTETDFGNRKQGTILGHLGILLDHIRQAGPNGKILVGNPVERADFVYLLDPEAKTLGYIGQRSIFGAMAACETRSFSVDEALNIIRNGMAPEESAAPVFHIPHDGWKFPEELMASVCVSRK